MRVSVSILGLLVLSFCTYGQIQADTLTNSLLDARKEAMTSFKTALTAYAVKSKRADSIKVVFPGSDAVIASCRQWYDSVTTYYLLADYYNTILTEKKSAEKPVRENWSEGKQNELNPLLGEMNFFEPRILNPVAPVYAMPECNVESPDFEFTPYCMKTVARYIDYYRQSKSSNDSLYTLIQEGLLLYTVDHFGKTLTVLDAEVALSQLQLNKDLVLLRKKLHKIIKKYHYVPPDPVQDIESTHGYTAD